MTEWAKQPSTGNIHWELSLLSLGMTPGREANQYYECSANALKQHTSSYVVRYKIHVVSLFYFELLVFTISLNESSDLSLSQKERERDVLPFPPSFFG
jgi:hypothetical protein